jgi:arginase
VAEIHSRVRSLGYEVADHGDIDVFIQETHDPGDPHMKYLKEIRHTCEAVRDEVDQVLGEGSMPVVLGGDHSIAMGTIAGVSRHYRKKDERIGLIWFDAHGDMNTPESSNSGNVHGMPLAHVLGLGDESLAMIGGFKPKVQPSSACLIGIRDLDEREKKLIADSGITVFTMRDIDRHGVSHVIDEAIERASRGTAGIHVSFDVDAIDPSEAQGVGTPKKGGLTYREAHLCLEIIADTKKLTSMDVVEINPILDTRNTTGELGAELILSALGKRIF